MILERFKPYFFEQQDIEILDRSGAEDADEAAKLAGLGRINDIVRPFCFFTGSIWQALHEDENPLLPRDAYWLGAIDEVLGSGLPSIRQVIEADSPDQKKLPLDLAEGKPHSK